jgi:hypothetical protein
MANFWETLSPHAQSLWNWQRPQIEKRMEERWARDSAARPYATLAQKMYGLSEKRLSDATRGSVSPLNGVAKPSGER